MLLNIIFCNHLIFVRWLQDYFIPCPFKKITGIDCPGCGFQRSFVALLQGNFGQSFHLYPATIPLLLVTVYTLADALWPFDTKQYLKKTLYIATAIIIAGSYIVKMSRYF